MIIYDLCCENAHRFEGWFRSADDFDGQLARHFIGCPQCDSHRVRRVPSAVAIGGAAVPVTESAALATASPGATMMPTEQQALALYRQLIRTVVENCEDVGSGFAGEARRIYYNEAPARPIRGQATEEERETLRDEGIEVICLPVIEDEKLN
ncbi:MAG: DUF1178 family protein [Azonexus sp.]|jgi:hypothetical protein|nr:DUF1178 family protein [Azonexus sp.]